jgi:formiminotetrahydrofolate cyclodeaminase
VRVGGVAAWAAGAAADGAFYNVQINLPGLKDEAFKKRIRESAGELRAEASRRAADIQILVESGLEKE